MPREGQTRTCYAMRHPLGSPIGSEHYARSPRYGGIVEGRASALGPQAPKPAGCVEVRYGCTSR